LRLANEALLRINHELERRVEEKTGEVMRNQNVLQVSQEVLEQLPVAVIGIGEDGVIAIANRAAHCLFSQQGTLALLGETAGDVIPPELLEYMAGAECGRPDEKHPYLLEDGRQASCWCCRMGEFSLSKGVVLVIDAGT
jgi:nitrogen fixation/metabolism regulation signal transduction histidine kinase